MTDQPYADSPEAHESRIAEIQDLTGITGKKTHLQQAALRLLHCKEGVAGPYKNADLFHAFGYLNNLLVDLESITAAHHEGAEREEIDQQAADIHASLGAMVKHFSLATQQYIEGSPR